MTVGGETLAVGERPGRVGRRAVLRGAPGGVAARRESCAAVGGSIVASHTERCQPSGCRGQRQRSRGTCTCCSPLTTPHGRPATRERVERAGATAWLAQLDRLIEYISGRHGAIPWTRDGIARVDQSWVDLERACPELELADHRRGLPGEDRGAPPGPQDSAPAGGGRSREIDSVTALRGDGGGLRAGVGQLRCPVDSDRWVGLRGTAPAPPAPAYAFLGGGLFLAGAARRCCCGGEELGEQVAVDPVCPVGNAPAVLDYEEPVGLL